MTVAAPITLQLPDRLYQRLVNTAQATQRSLESVVLHALSAGSPPDWDDIPDIFQTVSAYIQVWHDSYWTSKHFSTTTESLNNHCRATTLGFEWLAPTCRLEY
jgi:hypothetical protein